MTATTVNGCAFTNSVTVNNLLPPADPPTITSDNIEICEGEDIVLRTSKGGTQFEWVGPLGASTTTLAIAGLTTATSSTTLSPGHPSYLSGDYRVQVTDADGCVSISEPITITIHPIPSVLVSNSSPVCEGEDISLQASTVAGATYNWYDGDPALVGSNLISQDQNPVISGLAAGNHTYFATVEVNGCTSPTVSTTVTINELPATTPTAIYTLNADCSAADLSLSANASAGTAPYSYVWSGPNGFNSTLADPTIAGATEANNGTYDVLITDANGCTATGNVEVNGVVDEVPQPIITSTGPACEGETVTLSIPAYSGSSISYTWNTPLGTTTNITGENTNAITISPVVDGTHQGDYSVTVDVDGCVLTSPVYDLEIFDTPTAAPTFATPDNCAGGTLELFANATGVTDLTYAWSGPNDFSSTLENPTISDVDPSYNGEYVVTVTTLSGCSFSESVIVNTLLAPADPPTIAAEDIEICDGEDIVLITSKNGVQYEWVGPLGASASTLAIAGLTTGTGTTTLSPGHPSYLSGEYRVRVTDANGCTSTSAPITITIHPIPGVLAGNSGAECEGESVTLTANDVNGATYRWYDGDPLVVGSNLISQNQNPEISNLTAGTHDFYVTVEVNGCVSPSRMTTVTIYANPEAIPSADYLLSADCRPTDLLLYANATGGTGSYIFSWTGPNGFSSNVENPVIPDATAAANGSYSVTIIDDNGCTSTGSVAVSNIEDPLPKPLVSNSGQVCDGETVRIWVPEYDGSFVDYRWTMPSTVNVTGLNTHELTVDPVDSLLHEGDYYVEITIDNCVIFSDTFNLELHPTPTATPIATGVPLCEGDALSLTANASGAVSYAWSGPDGFTSDAENPVIENVTIANNGTYTLTVTNITGCARTVSINVDNIAPTPVQPTITSNAPVCIDGTIELAIQENYTGTVVTYNWTNGAGVSIGTASSISLAANAANAISPYRVAVTVDGCTSPLAEPHEVEVTDLPIATANNAGPVCAGEAGQLLANEIPGARYEWRVAGSADIISTQQNPVIDNILTTTTYELTIINNGCISDPLSTTTIEVYDRATTVPSASYALNVDCTPSDLQLFANVTLGDAAIASYAWTGPNGFSSAIENPLIPDATEANNGSYTLLITDANGCTASGSVEVNAISNNVTKPVISASGPTCEGGTVVLSITAYEGAFVDYIWSVPSTVNVTGLNTNQIVILPVEAAAHEGNYSVQVIVDGCLVQSDTYEVDVLDQPTAAPTATTGDICEGATLSLSANASGSGNLSYEWVGPEGFNSTLENPTLPNVTTANNGQYTLTVTSGTDCEVIASIDVTNILPAAETATIDSNAPICEGEDLVLSSSTTGVQYEWVGPLGASVATLAKAGLTTVTGITTLDPTHESYLPGEWYVRVTDASGCVSISDPIEVVISPVPVAEAFNEGPICPGDDVQLIATTVEGARYEWRNAATGTLLYTMQNPLVRGLELTTTYELTVIKDGCVSAPVATTTVTVNPSPTVNPVASYTLSPGCTPSDLSLSANATGSNLTYQWTGPNDFSSTAENPVIPNAIEAYNGAYQLVITDDAGCTASGVTNVVTDITNTVSQPIISSSGPACGGERIVLSVAKYEGATVDYQWNVPDNSNVTGLNTNEIVITPVDEATHEGNYNVTVIVDGCTLTSDTYVLDVLDTPTATPDATVGTICVGEELQLNANATNAATYAWTGPNGFTSNAANPQIANVDLNNNGTYTLTITSVSGCSITEQIIVNNIAEELAQPTVITAEEVCADGTIVLSLQQVYSPGTNYTWFNGEGDVIGGTSQISLLASDPAAISPYYAQVQTGPCVSELSTPVSVTVNALPQASAINNGPVCDDEPVQLFAGMVDDAEYRWYDDNPDTNPAANLISTDRAPQLYELLPGTYSFYLKVFRYGCGSADVARTDVTIYGIPEISNISGEGTYCEGSDVELSAENLVNVSGNVSYTWTGPNGFNYSAIVNEAGPFSVSLPNISASAEGTYTLSLTSENGCVADQASVNINIGQQPNTPLLDINNMELCEGEQFVMNTNAYTGTDVSYEWFFEDDNGEVSLGVTNAPTFFIDQVDPDDNGKYSVTVTIDGCSSGRSNVQQLAVFGATAPPVAENTTASGDPACEGELVQLTTELFVGATYQWFGPNDFTSDLPNPVINPVSKDDEGGYFAVVELNNCATVLTTTTFVFVQEAPQAPTIINNGPVCEGDAFTLSVSSQLNVPPGTDLTFDWYYYPTNTLVGTTSEPRITFDDVEVINGGEYYVVMTVGDGACTSPISEKTFVEINQVPFNEANAGEDINVCATNVVELDAFAPSIGSGYWTSPTGATISNPEQANTEAIDLREGENLFVWTLSNGSCLDYDQDTVLVNVSVVPSDEAYAGDDMNVCNGTVATLNALAPTVANGEWTQTPSQASRGVIIDDPTSPNAEISGLEVGKTYTFYWTLSEGTCEDFATDTLIVSVFDTPEIQAYVPEHSIYTCGEGETIITALEPRIGEGKWSTPGNARIIDPFEAETIIDDLEPGENIFVWSLSNGSCDNYSSDTLRVYREDAPEAVADEFFLRFDEELTDVSIFDNDFVGNINDYVITLVEGPSVGELSGVEEGSISYVPERNFFGDVEFTYSICNINCPELCSETTVVIHVLGSASVGDCKVPNVITPDNDGVNDALVVTCLDEYPDAKIMIFNRWGDKIHEAGPYQNDWMGTYKGEVLPAGTYFYCVQLAADEEPIQGYFTLIR
ncbi:MAG: gliding motility-associated C-terminal domain-containing protein [Bacteroidota bacterium]